MDVHIDTSRLVRLLLFAAVALVVAHLAGQYSRFFLGHDVLLGLIPRFNLEMEANVPTWFSSMLLAIASGLLAIIGVAARQERAPYARHWLLLSVVFVLLSLDETAQLHEMTLTPIRLYLGTSGLLYYAWVIPAMAFVLILAVAYLSWFLKLPRRYQSLFFASGVLYIGGAAGVELFEGRLTESGRYLDMTYMILVTIEETLELFGVLLCH